MSPRRRRGFGSWRAVGTLIAALAVAPTGLQAQTIRGTVLQEDSREPVSLALVLLLDETGRAVASRLTDDRGRFEIREPSEGVGRGLRAERIGLGVVTVSIEDHARGAELEVLLPVRPVPIEGIAVEAVDRCPADPRDAALADAWARFRPLLASLQELDRDEPRRFEIEYSEAELTSAGHEVARMLTDTLVTADVVPFGTEDPSALTRDGFVVQESDSTVVYYGPDARVLLSPEFIASHCYRLPEVQDRAGYLEIEFSPRTAGTPRDIGGVFALPLDESQLPLIEFTFTSHPWRYAPDPRLGGVVELAPTDFGWVVSRWELRVPGPPMVALDRIPPIMSMTAYRGRLLRVLTPGTP